MLTTIGYIVLGVVLLLLILNFLAPASYEVSRSIVIKRNRQEVFDYIKYLKNQDDWSPWQKKDPNMEKNFKGTDGEVGFTSHWKGNKDVGEGEQEITAIHPGVGVESELRFLKPFKSQSDAYMRLADSEGGSTQVTWGFKGDNKFPMRIMMLFMSMDKMIGKEFEEGLASLKSVMES